MSNHQPDLGPRQSHRRKRPSTRRRPFARAREQQAMATRLAILDAAQALFERDGYAATTIDAVAAGASVSVKTVYLAFVNKPGVLRAVWDRALKGDTDDAPVAQR